VFFKRDRGVFCSLSIRQVASELLIRKARRSDDDMLGTNRVEVSASRSSSGVIRIDSMRVECETQWSSCVIDQTKECIVKKLPSINMPSHALT